MYPRTSLHCGVFRVREGWVSAWIFVTLSGFVVGSFSYRTAIYFSFGCFWFVTAACAYRSLDFDSDDHELVAFSPFFFSGSHISC